jgi:hypothetical protein
MLTQASSGSRPRAVQVPKRLIRFKRTPDPRLERVPPPPCERQLPGGSRVELRCCLGGRADVPRRKRSLFQAQQAGSQDGLWLNVGYIVTCWRARPTSPRWNCWRVPEPGCAPGFVSSGVMYPAALCIRQRCVSSSARSPRRRGREAAGAVVPSCHRAIVPSCHRAILPSRCPTQRLPGGS